MYFCLLISTYLFLEKERERDREKIKRKAERDPQDFLHNIYRSNFTITIYLHLSLHSFLEPAAVAKLLASLHRTQILTISTEAVEALVGSCAAESLRWRKIHMEQRAVCWSSVGAPPKHRSSVQTWITSLLGVHQTNVHECLASLVLSSSFRSGKVRFNDILSSI